VTRSRRTDPEWRQFEQLIARIERDADELDVVIRSPDRIRCAITGRLREVDASIRTPGGALVTLECRKRRSRADVTWIEQLATKRHSLGADRTIAVSAAGFSANAQAIAREHAIELKRVDELAPDQLNPLLGLDLVLFWHPRVEIRSVEFRSARPGRWSMPKLGEVDLLLPAGTDVSAPIFLNVDEGHRWSLNDMWHQIVEAANPLQSVVRGEPPSIHRVCFSYPDNVTVDVGDQTLRLGDVIVTLALWWDAEAVWKSDATRVSYGAGEASSLHRLEFTSLRAAEDWSVAMQVPAATTNLDEMKTSGVWPAKLQPSMEK
jgi:hypothetical protein